jgi:hypothetical protein
LLDAYEDSALRLYTSAEIVDWFLGRPEVDGALAEIGRQRTFSACVSDSGTWLPALTSWTEQAHEVQLTERISMLSRGTKSPEHRQAILAASLQTLIALASRTSASVNSYAGLIFKPDYFAYYPINLQSFAFHSTETWAFLTMPEVLRWLLINWGVETHLRHQSLRAQRQ